jgi:predicted transposase YbfD/YdcC
MAIPVLETLDIAGKTLTADALLTQRKLAEYILARGAHDVFSVKDNQPNLHADIRLSFEIRARPDFRAPPYRRFVLLPV